MKNLVLIEPDLSRVVIFDNCFEGLVQPRNSVVVPTWNEGEDDSLVKCIHLLSKMNHTHDIRECVLDLRFY